ncbi:hypothetical protein [Bacillus sp. FJAT-45037]|uniref:hypothetical protein n=1 Tax=Bacillus sp. FJAT-45037 TaxID=2011007 RepID=UPI000C23D8AB|nr:hypothetical protein [Bacillus sp. FJAT-45037]
MTIIVPNWIAAFLNPISLIALLYVVYVLLIQVDKLARLELSEKEMTWVSGILTISTWIFLQSMVFSTHYTYSDTHYVSGDWNKLYPPYENKQMITTDQNMVRIWSDEPYPHEADYVFFTRYADRIRVEVTQHLEQRSVEEVVELGKEYFKQADKEDLEYRTFSINHYLERIIAPKFRSILKDLIAEYPVKELDEEKVRNLVKEAELEIKSEYPDYFVEFLEVERL